MKGSPFAAGSAPTSAQIDPSGKFLYVSCDGSNNVYAFKIGKTGALTGVSGSPFGTGDGPGGISLSPSGKYAYVPSYTLGSVWGYTINPTTGALKAISGSPWLSGTDVTAFAVDSTGKFGYGVNFGADNVSAYKVGSKGALTNVKGSPFSTDANPAWMAVCQVAKGVCKPPPL